MILSVIFINSVAFAATEVGYNCDVLNLKILYNQKVISMISKNLINKDNRVKFILEKTNLNTEQAKFLIKECEKKELNVFTILGLMKIESNFDEKTVGSCGERGLGQLMDGTARILAKNLNIEYNPEHLFKPKYNIQLFTTHLSYLKKVYKGDIHKILTAYNRGESGLKRYMASRGDRRGSAVSVYSSKVLKSANEFKKEYDEAYKN